MSAPSVHKKRKNNNLFQNLICIVLLALAWLEPLKLFTGVTEQVGVIVGCYSFHRLVVCELPTFIPTSAPDFL